MELKNVLPVDFDGVFRFTNFTENEFKACWDKIEYSFPAKSTIPLIIPNATPVEIQNIRKKFAKELATIEWYKTPKFVGMNAHTPGGTPALYTEEDLKPLIQRCLEPLPIAQATTKALPKNDDSRLAKDRKGRNVTRVLEGDESLLKEGSEFIE